GSAESFATCAPTKRGCHAARDGFRDQAVAPALPHSSVANAMKSPSPSRAETPEPTLNQLLQDFASLEESEESHAIVAALYPICRSITGDGMRQSLRMLQGTIPVELHEVPTGTRVFDWSIPKEWNITDAYIKNGKGERVVDFQR